MVIGALGSLGASAVRALARNLFAGFYERGISANQALGELREVGLGYRRQDFLADFRQGEGRYAQETRVSFLGLDKVPGEGILQPQYYGTPDRYSFVFKAEGFFTDTQETGTRYFTYHRNTLKSRAAMEAEAQDWMSNQSDVYGFAVESVSLREGYINPVWA